MATICILTVLFFNFYVTKQINFGITNMQQVLVSSLRETHLDINEEALTQLISQTFTTQDYLRDALPQLIHRVVFFYLILLFILLVIIRYYLRLEVSLPLTHLNDAINAFNKDNGFETSEYCNNEIQHLSNNFFLMSRQIEENKQRKDELISYISHDIKTPLTSILGYTQRLVDPGIKDPNKQLKYYETILTKANDIQAMIEELDTYISNETAQMNLEPTKLKPFLKDIVDQYEEEFLAYNVKFFTEIYLNHQHYVTMDQNAIRRVFGNIFSNAIFHGGNNITIHLLSFIKEGYWVTYIENNGPSLELDQYDQVFELMYQGDASRTSSSHKGKGLGLTIVKQIILKHNGNIKAYAPENGGFGIEFSLPITKTN